MFNNIGLHFELINPLSAVLLIIGGILGYGGKHILRLFNKEVSDIHVIALKTLGLALVTAGVLLIFV